MDLDFQSNLISQVHFISIDLKSQITMFQWVYNPETLGPSRKCLTGKNVRRWDPSPRTERPSADVSDYNYKISATCVVKSNILFHVS